MHPSTSKFARRGSGVKAEIGVPFVMVITEPIELPEPTRAIPGSEAKILILMERARKRQPLFHPDDLTNATTWVPSERGRFIVPDVT